MPLSEIVTTVIDTELVGVTPQFLAILGAHRMETPADFLTNLPPGFVRLVRVDPGRGRVVRAFVCADVDAAKFFVGDPQLTRPEFYWIPLINLPAYIVSRVEAVTKKT